MSTLALFVIGRENRGLRQLVRYGLFLGYCLFLCYLATRIHSPGGAGSAGPSVSVADAAFDVMVFALIQARFSELGKADRQRVEAEYLIAPGHLPDCEASGSTKSGAAAVVIDMLLLGVAVGLCLFLLLVVAAGPLHLDRNAAIASPRWAVLPGATALIALVTWFSDHALKRWRRSVGEPSQSALLRKGLGLPTWFGGGAITAATVWVGAISFLSAGPVHLPFLAAAVGILAFGFAFRTLLWSNILLQTLTPTLGQIAVCLAAGVSIGFGAFWFVSMGIWEGQRPLSGGWLAGSTICLFAGTVLVYSAAGLSLANGLPKARRPRSQFVLSREAVRGYVGLDAMNLGIVLLIGVALPLYAATRDQELHASSLNGPPPVWTTRLVFCS